MKNKFIREQIDILKGEGHDWDLLSTSALYKKELRKNTSKVEMIQSYLNASKKMYDVFKTNNHPAPGLSVIWSNPLCIPFLFLCRHTTELSIKYYLEKHNINFKSIHDIKSLYKKANIDNKEYDELIEAFNILDKTGTMLRYSVDNSDNEFRDKPYFVKSDQIMIYTEKLSKELLELSNK